MGRRSGEAAIPTNACLLDKDKQHVDLDFCDCKELYSGTQPTAPLIHL
jgi:hypothetical protein